MKGSNSLQQELTGRGSTWLPSEPNGKCRSKTWKEKQFVGPLGDLGRGTASRRSVAPCWFFYWFEFQRQSIWLTDFWDSCPSLDQDWSTLTDNPKAEFNGQKATSHSKMWVLWWEECSVLPGRQNPQMAPCIHVSLCQPVVGSEWGKVLRRRKTLIRIISAIPLLPWTIWLAALNWETETSYITICYSTLGEAGSLAADEFAMPINSIFADAISIPKLIMNAFLTSHEEKEVSFYWKHQFSLEETISLVLFSKAEGLNENLDWSFSCSILGRHCGKCCPPLFFGHCIALGRIEDKIERDIRIWCLS